MIGLTWKPVYENMTSTNTGTRPLFLDTQFESNIAMESGTMALTIVQYQSSWKKERKKERNLQGKKV